MEHIAVDLLLALGGEAIKSAVVGITFFGAHKVHMRIAAEVKRQEKNKKARAKRKMKAPK